VRAVQAWIAAAKRGDGPLFRPIDRHGTIADRRLSAQAVALIVKKRAAAAGLDASALSAHSLRTGLATSAAAAGVGERQILRHTGHTSTVVIGHYIWHGELFRDNAAEKVGL
jgi:integrase